MEEISYITIVATKERLYRGSIKYLPCPEETPCSSEQTTAPSKREAVQVASTALVRPTDIFLPWSRLFSLVHCLTLWRFEIYLNHTGEIWRGSLGIRSQLQINDAGVGGYGPTYSLWQRRQKQEFAGCVSVFPYVIKSTVYLDATDGECVAKCPWKLCRSKDNVVLILRRILIICCNLSVLRVLWAAPEAARGKLGQW